MVIHPVWLQQIFSQYLYWCIIITTILLAILHGFSPCPSHVVPILRKVYTCTFAIPVTKCLKYICVWSYHIHVWYTVQNILNCSWENITVTSSLRITISKHYACIQVTMLYAGLLLQFQSCIILLFMHIVPGLRLADSTEQVHI